MDKVKTNKQMCTFFVLFTFLFGPALSSVLPTVNRNPDGFIPLLGPEGNGSRASPYLISKYTATWVNARDDCLASGMKLLAIKSAAIQTEIAFFLNLNSVTDDLIYTSGNDIQSEGTKVWGDGARFIYENEYCVANSAGSNCMVIHKAYSWQWHFLACTSAYKFICET